MAPAAITATEHQAPIILDRTEYRRADDHACEVAKKSKELVKNALNTRIQGIDADTCPAGEEDAFFVADLGEIYRQQLRWKRNLPRVKPHYAVKCNPNPQVIRLLASLGTGFDCASKAEIDQILMAGVAPERIIYAQPCKTKSYIRHAAAQGVKQMTFDNADELHKTAALFPDAELYLRILTDDSSSLCRLSLKFGASLDTTLSLLQLAKDLRLNVVGVSFHVGSGASDPQSFVKAVCDARIVFDQAATVGFELHTLDVGGGFTSGSFELMAAALTSALDDHFPPYVRVIAEPGRYYVAEAFTLACHVIARRDLHDDASGATSYMLYLNDGVYGNFSSIIFDHQHPVPQILTARSDESAPLPTEYSIWGPTCDGIDRIVESVFFSRELDVGDWLFFEEMGAYTMCSATRFNGFTNQHDVLYISSEAGASAIMEL